MAPLPGQTYIYSALPTDSSIRVLRIVSGVGEPIRVILEPLDLGEHPLYDCLSYTWADPLYHNLSPLHLIKRITGDRNIPINCNGLVLFITENLRDALLQLTRNGLSSRKDHSHQYQRQSRIWIDAVCIDQGNLNERSSQVAMMSEIYRLAKTVIVWLGTNDMHTEAAINVLNRLASIPREKREVEINLELQDPEVYKILGIDYIEPQYWLSYAAFLQRTWFSRMWVIQETFLANEIVVFCGPYVLSWPAITAGSHLLRETRLGDLLMADVANATHSLDTSMRSVGNVIANQFIFENMREKAASLNLEKLLAYSRYFKATEDKDRVYALLGMWAQSLTHKKTPETITPDYDSSVSVEQVYTEASWATLREMADLNILSLVEDQSIRKLRTLSSWIPDFSVTPQAHPLIGNPRAAPGKERWKAGSDLKWDATMIRGHGQPPPPLKELRTYRLLPVEGIRIDTIAERAATQEEITDQYALKSLLQLLSNALRHPKRSHNSNSKANRSKGNTATAPVPPPMEAFWRGLIKDTFRTEPANNKARAAFPLFIVRCVWELEQALANLRNAANPSDKEEEPPISPDPGVDPTPKLEPGPDPHPSLQDLELIHAQTKALVCDLSAIQSSEGIGEDEVDGHVKVPGGVIPLWDTIQHVISGESEGSDQDTAFDSIWQAFETAYAGRRLFRTENLNYIGIAARSLQEGDALWVLAGADAPMVLRRADGGGTGDEAGRSERVEGDRWTLVGEAYVWGLMDGEAVQRGGQGGQEGVELEEIYLE